MSRGKKSLVFVVSLILASSMAMANGLNLNGFGARAAAMGGAFVGLADDFTAVFWNPAGLAFQGATLGLTADAIMPKGEYDMLGLFDMKTKSKVYPAGLGGYFRPINDRLVVGLGVYTPSGLGAAWNSAGFETALISPLPPSFFIPPVESYRWESFIGAITIAPTVAVKLSDMIAFGATLNVNYGFFKLWQWAGTAGEYPTLVNLGQQTLDVHGWGYGATFGLLVKPSDKFSFGATFRTPSKMKLSGTTEVENLDVAVPGIATTSATELEVTYPMWIAGGLAFKPVSNLTFTFDAQYTNWDKLDELDLVFGEALWALAIPPEEATLELHWSDKIQWRGGAELLLGSFALRGGYYYDPTPTPDETLNILVPGFDFNAITFGFGYNKGGLKLDLAFEYLMGKEREILPGKDVAMPGTYCMKILVPMISFSYGW